jgi:ABC-type transport system involved in multi-copper enzyme maturation permease subunit
MIWLTWRQFRVQAITAVTILVVAAAYLLITGTQLRDSYNADQATCAAQNDCVTVLNQLLRSHNAAFQLVELFVIAAPALIGIFWGAPLIGRELESGTHQLVWNQSITRGRWLAVKLAGVGLAGLVVAAVISSLLTWWAGPLDRINGDRFAAMTFATRDVTPLGYALFAFALGTTFGLVLRRSIPAMAVTLAVFVTVQVIVPTVVRPNLLPSTTVTYAINATNLSQANGISGTGGSQDFFFSGLPVPQGAWLLDVSPVEDAAGRPVRMSSFSDCLPGPGTKVRGKNPFTAFGTCVARDDLHESVTYQPSSHYWPLQWYETGAFLALACGLFVFCFWWIRRRRT